MSNPIIAPVPANPHADIVDVTPALAREWLGRNVHNRNVRQAKVDGYARDMTAGLWLFNGDAIRFSMAGALLDGQHRLLAVDKSGVTITSLVVWGLEAQAQDTMDAGARRSAGDALKLRGLGNYSTIAAVAKRALIWERGSRDFDTSSCTTAEVVQFVTAHSEVVTAADAGQAFQSTIPAPPSVIGLCYWLFAAIDQAKTDEFFSALSSGANLHTGHPILTLRNKLVDLRRPTGRKPEQDRLVALFVRAWNAWRTGKNVQRMQLATGRGDDQFPLPK